MGGFNADEHLFKTALDHQSHQFPIIGQVNGCFGVKVVGMVMLLHPVDECRKRLVLELAFVADEIVIHEKHTAPPPALVEDVQLRYHLLTAFGARHPAEKLCNVAEFTVERATAGILD